MPRNKTMLTLSPRQITCISFKKKLIWRKLIILYKRNLSRKFLLKRRKKPCWLLRFKSKKTPKKSRDNNKKRLNKTKFQTSYLIIISLTKMIIYKRINPIRDQTVSEMMMMIRLAAMVSMHSETSQIHVTMMESKLVLMRSNKTISKMNNINNT